MFFLIIVLTFSKQKMRKIFSLMLLCATILLTSCSDDDSVAATGVNLDKTTLSITVGETATLTATVIPDDASVKDVSWTSGNPSVVTISEKGVITAISAGEAVITVTTIEGGLTAMCSVTVEPLTISVTGVTLNKSTLELKESLKEALTATVSPQDATNQKVTWSSSNPDVASVDASTGEVTAKVVGKATITATTEDGEKSATCEITVTPFVSTVYATEIGDGVEPAGSGTEENPYLIEYAQNLKWMKIQNGSDGAGTAGKYYKLVNDINVTSDTWIAIKLFQGNFDGNNHKITGKLIASDDTNFGFIGSLTDGTIKNLQVEAEIYAPNAEGVGGVVGRFFDEKDSPSITNCTNAGMVTGFKKVGGLIGYYVGANTGTSAVHSFMLDCVNKGAIFTLDNSVGGCIGSAFLNTPHNESLRHKYCIEKCKNEGNVTGTTETTYGPTMGVAGITGYVLANSNIFYVKGCSNASTALIKLGDITATSDIQIGNKASRYVGWFVGRDSNGGSIQVE